MSADFLTFLVNETFKHKQAEGTTLFEQKLNDYGLNYKRGEFIPQLQILRFNTELGLIDCPVNWSLFSIEDHIIIDENKDSDHLFSILNKHWPMNKLLIAQADGFCFMVFLKKGEDVHLRDLLNPQEFLIKAA